MTAYHKWTIIGCFFFSYPVFADPLSEMERNQALEKWRALRESGKWLRGKFEYAQRNEDPNAPPRHVDKGEFLFGSASAYIRYTERFYYRQKNHYSEHVVGYNPKYAFTLGRAYSFSAEASAQAPFNVEFLGQPDENFKTEFYLLRHSHLNCAVPWAVNARSMIEWLEDPHFVVNNAVNEEKNGRVLRRWDCQYTADRKNTRPNWWFTKMSIWFDQNRDWQVIQYRCEVPLPARPGIRGPLIYLISGTVDYLSVDHGRPIPGTYTVTGKARELHIDTTTYLEWEYLKHEPEESQFQLSAFGLPDPQPAVPSSRGWLWLWLLAGAVIVGIAGFWLRVRGR